MPLPTTLSPAFVVATLLPLLLGIVNYTIQSKKILGQWPLPAKVSPYLAIFGSYLTGVTSFVASQSPFVFNTVTIFVMFVAGIYSLVLGQQTGNVMHHFGAAIHRLRPAPRKIDPDAVTEPPPAS